MKRITFVTLLTTTLAIASAALFAGCSKQETTVAAAESAPPPTEVDHESDGSLLRVDHPERFVLASATTHEALSALTVTGVVSPDVSLAVPVISLASGRVIEVRARLGDQVTKGDLLLRLHSADVSGAVADYKKAHVDDVLAQSQLQRAQELFDRGAIAKKDLEVAQDTADKAGVDVENSLEHLQVLGVDPALEQSDIVDIKAPASGVITEQNVTNAAGVKTLDNSPNLFTISDLSHVWIVCDVYENNLSDIRVGDSADIHLAAYPDHTLTGRIDNIGPTLDPALRTAKVRIEVENPGLMRFGMFVTATFHGQQAQTRTVVPAAAILHLHDRDWVYLARRDGQFRRQEVVGGQMLPGNMQELNPAWRPATASSSNALVFQNTAEQ